MKRRFYAMLLLTSTVCCAQTVAQQTVEVNSIAELRKQSSGTQVVLTMSNDTVLATTDGGLCLNDGARIRIEGIDQKPSSIISGMLNGRMGTWQGHPLFEVSPQESDYQLLGSMSWTMTIDMEGYEALMAKNEGGGFASPWEQVPDDPRTGITTVSTIKELKKLEADTEARLVLGYDTVLFVSNGDAYVRDGSDRGSINFRDMGLDLKEGMVLLGSVVGRLVKDGAKAQFVATENTTSQYFAVIAEMPYLSMCYDMDVEEQDDYVDDVVVTGEVTVDSLPDADGVRRLYAFKQDNGSRLLLTDRYGFISRPVIVPAVCANLRGVLASCENGGELFVLTDIGTQSQPVAISLPRWSSTSDASPRYTLSGQRVTPTFRGVTISRNRKKIINQ